MDDPFELERFIEAQRPVFDTVLGELKDGRKRSHWMWFVFPQIAGLGGSAMAMRYAIGSRDEARAYLAHPILGSRLRHCIRLLNAIKGRTAHEIFGTPDDLKLRSSLTLFADAAPEEPLFADALKRFYAGQSDPNTLDRLP